MALYEVPGPQGGTFQFEAPDDNAAAAAIDELYSSGGEPKNFATNFDPSQDSPQTMEGLDQRLGRTDARGRVAEALNSAFMGYGDEVMAAIGGGLEFIKGGDFNQGYNHTLNDFRETKKRYEERHPYESTAVDIAASLPTALVPGGVAARGAGLASKVARGAIAGATYGGVRGFGEGEDGLENRVKEMAKGAAGGAVVGVAIPVVGNAIGKVVGKRLGRGAVPSTDQLDDAATALYQRADNAGVAVQPRALQRLTTVLPQRMSNMGFDPVLHPNAARALSVIEQRSAQGGQPTGGAHTVFSLGEVENIRRVIRQAISASSGPDKKADRLMAQRVLDQFDMWMNGLQPRDMLAAGPISGREAIGIIQEARNLWSRKSKGDVLADMVERAQLDDNLQTGLRREFRTLARNKERMRQFTKQEQESIRKVAKGGNMGWLTRTLGALSPTTLTGGIRSTIGAGGALATGNPMLAAAIPAVGYAAKKVGEASTRRAADRAGAVVRSGGSMPVSPKGKVVGDYASRLLGAAGQAAAPSGISVMFPNDAPGVWR